MRTSGWWMSVLGAALLMGCGGPISIGNGGDGNATPNPTPTPSTSTFTATSANAAFDVYLGDTGTVTITLTPVDGYAGTVNLQSKSVVPDLSVEFQDTGGAPLTSIALDGTNPIDVVAAFTSNVVDDGTNITVPGPYNGLYTIELTDGTESTTVDVQAKVGPIWVYTLTDLNADSTTDPFFPHGGGIMTLTTDTVPVFIHNGSVGHEIHTGNPFTHMSGVNFSNGTAWSPVDNAAYDLAVPADVAMLLLDGVLPANDAGTGGDFYCHTDTAADHEGRTDVAVIANPN